MNIKANNNFYSNTKKHFNNFGADGVTSQKNITLNSNISGKNINFKQNINTNKNEALQDDKKQGSLLTKKNLVKAGLIALAAVSAIVLLRNGKKDNVVDNFKLKDNINSIKTQTDSLLGEGFFKGKLDEAGWEIKNWEKIEDSELSQIKDTTILEDIGHTIKDIPGVFLDMVNGVRKLLKKPTETGILANRATENKKYEARNLVLNIINQYKDAYEKNKDLYKENEELGIEAIKEKFSNTIAKNISHANPNYRVRDERTLNRLTTGLVSTIYAGNDFYNISMLQKDDKDDAKKSCNTRMKQEGSRMALNAAIGFFTYGALDKYIKNSKIGTVASAGLAALTAEVVSRLISKTPLIPLTSEAAKKISEKNKAKTTDSESKNSQDSKDVHFKGINKQQIVFKDFLNSDGSFTSLSIMRDNPADNNTDNKPKKKGLSKFGKTLIAAFGLFSIYEVLKSANITGKHMPNFDKILHLSELKTFITKKTKTIDLDKLSDEITSLKDTAGKNTLLDTYLKMIDELKKGTTDGKLVHHIEDRNIIAPIYNGFAKMGKTIAFILELPGKAIFKVLNNLPGKLKVEEYKVSKPSNKLVENVVALNNIMENSKLKDNTAKLNEILERARKVKGTELEMGDLASDCRTLATAVSTYFFVNDYRNKVLIESGGKDKEGAAEETKTRLIHKGCNFVFNGTLMNLFNSAFKTWLNKSIVAAAIIPMVTEFCNENLIRLSICSPAKKMDSRQAIIDYDTKHTQRKGFLGAYTRFFKKLTGKKSITEKAKASKK